MIETLGLTVTLILLIALVLWLFSRLMKKDIIGDAIVKYIKDHFKKELGYKKTDMYDIEIKYEDKIPMFGFIFLSIYHYEGIYTEIKVSQQQPYEWWLEAADELIESHLTKVERAMVKKNAKK